MARFLIGILTIGLLLGGTALADEDMWADDAVVTEEVAAPAPAAEVEVTAEGPHYLGDPGALGMYFGTGDNLANREVVYIEGVPYAAQPRAAADATYHDERIYAPHGTGEGEYGYDNVYGPLWGVPGDAVGMEGYDPNFYLLHGEAGTELTEEQLQAMRNYAGHGGAVAPEHQHATEDEAAAEEQVDGLDLDADADEWLD